MADRADSLFTGKVPLGFDPEEAVRALRAADPALARLIERVGPLRLGLQALHGPYEALAEAIVHQQLTARAAGTILGRLRDLSGGGFPAPEALLAAPSASLRAAGLSAPKAAALRDLAARTLDGTVPALDALLRMDDEEIVRRLDPIRGVGRWTVEMFLIFRLGRPDVLPLDDYGLRKGFARTFRVRGLPDRDRVARRGERWRPFRTAASWYLWRALEQP